MSNINYKQKYLKYKTKYITIIDEKKKCGNIFEQLFSDKIRCSKNEYCNCDECKQKKPQNASCTHNKECISKNCDYDPITKIGKCSSETLLLQQLFVE